MICGTEEMSKFQIGSSFNSSKSGATSVALNSDYTLCLSGNKKGKIYIYLLLCFIHCIGHVTIFSYATGEQIFDKKAHSHILNVFWIGLSSHFVSSCEDGSVSLWTTTDSKSWTAHNHKLDLPIVNIEQHPCEKYMLATFSNSFALLDMKFNVLMEVKTENTCTITASNVHPDGALLAIGTMTGQIYMYDLKTQQKVHTFDTIGQTQYLCFSENGYFLASFSAGDSFVNIWDLRKLVCLTKLEVPGAVTGLKWDKSGTFIGAVCGAELVYIFLLIYNCPFIYTLNYYSF